MLKNKLNTQNVIVTVLLLIVVVFTVFTIIQSNKKVVYTDNIKLFDNFRMTKELKRVEKEFNARKSDLDAMYSQLQSETISDQDKKEMMQLFIQRKGEFEQFNEKFASQESSKIWKRIHSYTEEYAKEKNYQLVIGSINKENVLFADESIDITNELLTYINKKYEGVK